MKKQIDETISVDVYYSFDEETGYHLDRESITDEFMSRLGEIENNIDNLNHERNDHLRTKHMEFPERETDGAEL
tara:strand:- start:1439 stop:1660 length:222 start_codon:yes stop_codon:yes gene_type:complete